MATIIKNQKNSKTVSRCFITCLGRDAQKKPIRRFKTWTPPEGITPARIRKASEREADIWEQEAKADYQKAQEAAAKGQAYIMPPEKRHDDFASLSIMHGSPSK